jgi:hypothetical protein
MYAGALYTLLVRIIAILIVPLGVIGVLRYGYLKPTDKSQGLVRLKDQTEIGMLCVFII